MSTTEQADTPAAAPVEQPVGDGPLAGMRVLDLGTVLPVAERARRILDLA